MLTKKQCSRERKRLGIRHFSSLGLVRTMLANARTAPKGRLLTGRFPSSIHDSGSANYQSVLAQTCIEANRPLGHNKSLITKFHTCEI